jgi:hypothetical protein
MVGSIALTDILEFPSWEARANGLQKVRDLLDFKRQDDWYPELLDSIRRGGIKIPVLIREDREFSHGLHRVAAAQDLGMTEVPVTDDPEIGWEDDWPDEQIPDSCP